ncbi:Xaa-Pro peptidase family protein [Pseudotabrizicola sp. 4114]|uniref:Xaa-Pro peptidase family protein n=1 Tax=Pseudotabrizicola sp. 4114 TaxID=2817731 RepID=UPI00285E42CC|nr:Xaa-Pro aminopeptidase [Pseudorhodobacter sp. 4114]
MLTNRTPIEEYHGRWSRAQALCKANGVEALVVWGKGGGTIDTAFDLIYLANYCPTFPYIADLPNVWSGISHAAVIIPATGEPVLVTDTDAIRSDFVAIKDIRPGNGFLPDSVADTLKSMGLGASRIGLVAGASLVANIYRRLVTVCKDIEFVDMDMAIESLRNIKTPFEFQLLREAADVGNAAMLAMMKSASTAGTTEADAVAAAYNVAIRRGSAIIDAACASGPHTKLYSDGMVPQWTTRTLAPGDIFHCDMYGAAVEGYVWDFSRTVVAGGTWTARQNEVYDGAIAAIEAGVAACRPGVTASDLYKAVHDVLEGRGIFCGYPIHGHSFGLGWGGPWLVPDNEMKVEAGMAIAIECMAGCDDVGYVKFEHNLLVHGDRSELISTCPARL